MLATTSLCLLFSLSQ